MSICLVLYQRDTTEKNCVWRVGVWAAWAPLYAPSIDLVRTQIYQFIHNFIQTFNHIRYESHIEAFNAGRNGLISCITRVFLLKVHYSKFFIFISTIFYNFRSSTHKTLISTSFPIPETSFMFPFMRVMYDLIVDLAY